MLHILLAEDNIAYRNLMKIHLERAGYQVFCADDGEQALEILDHELIHLLIADVMMPNIDGLELTEQIRNAHYTMPILIITARGTLEDKRNGFKSGADDYMTKPIEMDEMLLRVEALLRRANISKEHLLKIGDCTLDSDSLSVTRKDHTIQLRQKEFFLAQKLLSYPGKIFTRQALMDEIWGFDTETDPRTVDVHIKRLREKLGKIDEFEFETVRGLGYRAVLKEREE